MQSAIYNFSHCSFLPPNLSKQWCTLVVKGQYSMFSSNDLDYIKVSLETTKFLGTEEIAKQVIDLFHENPLLKPKGWNLLDEKRKPFNSANYEETVNAFCKDVESEYIEFYGKVPVEFEASLVIEKYPRAGFNRTHWFIRDNILKKENGQQILLELFIKLAAIFKVSHGFIAHTIQEKKQSPSFTLERRLPGVYWVNFFGKPYIEFFGRDKFVDNSMFQSKEIGSDLFMIKLEEDFKASMKPEFESKIELVKTFLGKNAFATKNFPDKPCIVPVFDFSELRNSEPAEGTVAETVNERFELMGFSPIHEDEIQVVFQSAKGDIVEFNKVSKIIKMFETAEIRDDLYKLNLLSRE